MKLPKMQQRERKKWKIGKEAKKSWRIESGDSKYTQQDVLKGTLQNEQRKYLKDTTLSGIEYKLRSSGWGGKQGKTNSNPCLDTK